jgi:hypothetical protein
VATTPSVRRFSSAHPLARLALAPLMACLVMLVVAIPTSASEQGATPEVAADVNASTGVVTSAGEAATGATEGPTALPTGVVVLLVGAALVVVASQPLKNRRSRLSST